MFEDIICPEVDKVEIFIDDCKIYLLSFANSVVEHELDFDIFLFEDWLVCHWDVAVLGAL